MAETVSANKSVLGQTLTLDGVPSLIIGVLPPGFHFAPVGAADYWIPLHWTTTRDIRTRSPLSRRRTFEAGISVATAYADLRRSHSKSQSHTRVRTAIERGSHSTCGCHRRRYPADADGASSGAGLLSLVGFVNVSSLLLVKTENRRREIAVRSALGASRGRLIYSSPWKAISLRVGMLHWSFLAFCAVGLLPGLIPPRLLDNMPYLQHLHLNAHYRSLCTDDFYRRRNSLRRLQRCNCFCRTRRRG